MSVTYNDGPKIRFLRGTQASLRATGTNAILIEDGVFYLTTDTGRLYVGQGATNTQLVELNKSITEVSAITKNESTGKYTVTVGTGKRTPEAGEFYYYATNNILMVGAENGQLVLVNPDNDTNIHLSSVLSSISTSGSGNSQIVQANHQLVLNEAVIEDGNSTTNTLNLLTKFQGGNRILVGTTSSNSIITIAAATSTFTHSATTTSSSTANLTVNGEASVTLKGEAGGITFVKDTDDSLKLVLPAAQVIPTYSLQQSSSGTGANTVQLIKLNQTTGETTATVSTLEVSPVRVTYGHTTAESAAASTATTYYNSTGGVHQLDLDIYNRSLIDEKFSSIASAMDYLGATTAIPNKGSGASDALVAGDMWKASAAISNIPISATATASAKVGDLIIRNKDGYFDIIPSGDDQNISVYAADASNLFQVKDGNNSLGLITFSTTAGTTANGLVNFTTTATENKNLSVSAKLPTITTSSSVGSTTEATSVVALANNGKVITGITTDSYGRLTGYTYGRYSVPVQPDPQTLSISASSEGNGVQKISKATLNISLTASPCVLQSSSLEIGTVTANTAVSIELQWGSF